MLVDAYTEIKADRQYASLCRRGEAHQDACCRERRSQRQAHTRTEGGARV